MQFTPLLTEVDLISRASKGLVLEHWENAQGEYCSV